MTTSEQIRHIAARLSAGPRTAEDVRDLLICAMHVARMERQLDEIVRGEIEAQQTAAALRCRAEEMEVEG